LEEAFAIILLALIIGGVGLIAYSLVARHRFRELLLRVRIAMIEKGLVPPPEVDPEWFEQLTGMRRVTSARGARYRTSGIMFAGFGAGLMMLIGFAAGAPETAVGIGGGLIVLGAAFIVNGFMLSRDIPAETAADRPAGPRRSPMVEPPAAAVVPNEPQHTGGE
jgi:hypothetical protein